MYLQDRAALAEDRSRFFWWLSEWFLHPPTRDMLAGLAMETELDPADVLDEAWLELRRAAGDPATLDRDELGAEYTRLLGGILEGMGPPPPYESVWRGDQLLGDTTLAVINAYAKAGFADIAPEAGPQDHIAVELKFLALCALREAGAWRAGDAKAAQQRLIQQRAFIEQHLGVWARHWADEIARQARLPLYAALAALLKAGLDQTIHELEGLERYTT